MTDKNARRADGAFAREPERDQLLSVLLSAYAGRAPDDAVDWPRLANRIAARIAAHGVSPWWSYAARWERRMIPLALAAGVAGAISLWSDRPSAINAQHEMLAAVVLGVPAADAVHQFARSVTSTAVDLASGVPE